MRSQPTFIPSLIMKFAVGPLSPPLKLSLMLMEWVSCSTRFVLKQSSILLETEGQRHGSGVRPESKLQLPGARSMKTLFQKMLPCSEKSLMGRRERILYFCLTQWHRGWWTGTFLPLETRCQGQRSGQAGVNIVNKIASHFRVISVTQNNKQRFGSDAYRVRGLMTIFTPPVLMK